MNNLVRHADALMDGLKREVSPGVRRSAERAAYGVATEFKARRKAFAAIAKFRSEMQDAAALSPIYGTHLLRFLSIVQEHAPSAEDWDQAMELAAEAGRMQRDYERAGARGLL